MKQHMEKKSTTESVDSSERTSNPVSLVPDEKESSSIGQIAKNETEQKKNPNHVLQVKFETKSKDQGELNPISEALSPFLLFASAEKEEKKEKIPHPSLHPQESPKTLEKQETLGKEKETTQNQSNQQNEIAVPRQIDRAQKRKNKSKKQELKLKKQQNQNGESKIEEVNNSAQKISVLFLSPSCKETTFQFFFEAFTQSLLNNLSVSGNKEVEFLVFCPSFQEISDHVIAFRALLKQKEIKLENIGKVRWFTASQPLTPKSEGEIFNTLAMAAKGETLFFLKDLNFLKQGEIRFVMELFRKYSKEHLYLLSSSKKTESRWVVLRSAFLSLQGWAHGDVEFVRAFRQFLPTIPLICYRGQCPKWVEGIYSLDERIEIPFDLVVKKPTFVDCCSGPFESLFSPFFSKQFQKKGNENKRQKRVLKQEHWIQKMDEFEPKLEINEKRKEIQIKGLEYPQEQEKLVFEDKKLHFPIWPKITISSEISKENKKQSLSATNSKQNLPVARQKQGKKGKVTSYLSTKISTLASIAQREEINVKRRLAEMTHHLARYISKSVPPTSPSSEKKRTRQTASSSSEHIAPDMDRVLPDAQIRNRSTIEPVQMLAIVLAVVFVLLGIAGILIPLLVKKEKKKKEKKAVADAEKTKTESLLGPSNQKSYSLVGKMPTAEVIF